MDKELRNRLEEAAEKYTESQDYMELENEFLMDDEGTCITRIYRGSQVEDSFLAGAEWQKEQDQPITGNSLEQEWLRYVDKKKKESGGELPALGEYGWLQIARHFANWQKQQMIRDCSVQAYYEAEIEKAEELGYKEAIALAKEWLDYHLLDYNLGEQQVIKIIADLETAMNKL